MGSEEGLEEMARLSFRRLMLSKRSPRKDQNIASR
jgi:hypothetical protein